ncbi:MAG: hydrolase [Desulfobacteraceae bacterium]|nr:hydrolase [Desulfobacteraceae bacterium]
MLTSDQAVLLMIDVQGKLARTVFESGRVLSNLEKLVRGARLFGLPVIVTEQNPKGLGPTIPEIQKLLGDFAPVEKTAFNACGDPSFVGKIRETGRSRILVCGIEAHVCVYQTVAGLIGMGFEVEVAADAVSSRNAENLRLALDRMRGMGAAISSTEMALFELMQAAEGEAFSEFIRIVK